MKNKKFKKLTNLEIYLSMRKDLPPPSRRHKNKKKYNRRDYKGLDDENCEN